MNNSSFSKCIIIEYVLIWFQRIKREATHSYQTLTVPEDSAANVLYVNGTLFHRTEKEIPASFKVCIMHLLNFSYIDLRESIIDLTFHLNLSLSHSQHFYMRHASMFTSATCLACKLALSTSLHAGQIELLKCLGWRMRKGNKRACLYL